MGIEPTFLAWEATFLPLEDTRLDADSRRVRTLVATSLCRRGASIAGADVTKSR